MTDTARKRILLGLTGGIAAYKSAELVRRLSEREVEVHVVMTQAACGFITPATMQALSGHPVYTDMWDTRVSDSMAHIALSRDKDLILVAPATADFLAKVAHGLGDDLLSTLCLARECPLVVAPAMNRQMWENAANQRNIRQLRSDGVEILGPESGDQACGEIGMGRMLEAIDIAEAVVALLAPKTLAGRALSRDSGTDIRGDRRGARPYEQELRQDGLRGGTRGTRSRRGRDARVGAERAHGAARHRARGRRVRGRHARRSQAAHRRSGCLRERGGRRGLSSGQGERTEDQEVRTQHDARARADAGYPRLRGQPAEAALLRRLCRRKREARRIRGGEAQAQEGAAARGEYRAGRDRRRRKRDHALR